MTVPEGREGSVPTGRGSKYDSYTAGVNKLKPNGTYLIPVSGDDDATRARNRLNGAMRPKLRKLPRGWRFVFRVSTDKQFVVVEYGRGL